MRRLVPGGERTKLTALYGGMLVLVCAAAMLLVFTLVRHTLPTSIGSALAGSHRLAPGVVMSSARPAAGTPAAVNAHNATEFLTDTASRAALGGLLTASLVTFSLFSALSVLLAWWMAGRVLRPVAVITATARSLSAERLHQRIGLRAPDGELKRLADTFDDMLDRIERLVSAQQRFVANAAHELRTRLAVQRSAAEIGLARADPRQVERIRRTLIETADDSERLIEGLLLLAVSDQGLSHPESVRIDALAEEVARALAEEARDRCVALRTRTEPLTVFGDAVLIRHLVHNLAGNAVRYNVPDGCAEIRVAARGLEVINTGPPIPDEAVPRLFEPFHRLQPRRHAPGEGAGLGLSIVSSIARAHDAALLATANPGGGLTVRVAFRATGSRCGE